MTHKARKERVHRCDDCNLTFRTEKSLARHRELHDPTRPLACPKCPLRWVSLRVSLNVIKSRFSRNVPSLPDYRHSHLKWHTNLFFNRYKNKDQLVRHKQTHEKPNIECELCHRVFGRPDHLKRHIATKHASLPHEEQINLSESVNKRKHANKQLPKQPPKPDPPQLPTQPLTNLTATFTPNNFPEMMLSLKEPQPAEVVGLDGVPSTNFSTNHPHPNATTAFINLQGGGLVPTISIVPTTTPHMHNSMWLLNIIE